MCKADIHTFAIGLYTRESIQFTFWIECQSAFMVLAPKSIVSCLTPLIHLRMRLVTKPKEPWKKKSYKNIKFELV